MFGLLDQVLQFPINAVEASARTLDAVMGFGKGTISKDVEHVLDAFKEKY